jgi:hypothetical protein
MNAYAIDWNAHMSVLNDIAEAALENPNAEMLIGMARVGIAVEDYADDEGDEAAKECSRVIRDSYMDRVTALATIVWKKRREELEGLAISHDEIRETIDECYLNAARGIEFF